MILSYERDMTHNYMIPESEEPLQERDYQIHMMTENHIEGLLPCSVRKMNGTARYFYDITSRQSVDSICERDCLGEKEIRIFLKGLYKTLAEVRRYLLDPDKVMLDPKMIYLDVETGEPLFCYLPTRKEEIPEAFHRLTEYLLQKLERSDPEAVLLCYELYRRSMEENYSLEKLLKEAAYHTEEKRLEHPVPKRRTEEMNTVTVPESELPDPEKRKPVRIQAINTQLNTTQTDKPWTEKPRPEKGKRGKMGLLFLVILCLAAGVIGLAAWIWKLNVTQVGGISFLMAGCLGYGISFEKKQREKKKDDLTAKEKKADRSGVRRQKKLEKRYRKEPVQRKPEVEKWDEPVQKSLPGENESDKKEPEKIGATVLLSPGEEEYEPHLALISMNPRERNSIVLLNDSYIIGKLKNKTDICIDHPSISRLHARITREGKEFCLTDLNSTNGTYVNGRRLAVNEKVKIQLTDEVRFAELGYYVGKC